MDNKQVQIILVTIFPKVIRNQKFKHMTRTLEQLEKEQPGLKDINCPVCNCSCWISSKKREIIKKNKNIIIKCWDCIADDGDILKSVMQQI